MTNAAALDVAPRDTSETMEEHGVLTKEQVKDILGINEATFYRYRRLYPSFRTFRTGRRTKMRRAVLERFLEELEDEQNA